MLSTKTAGFLMGLLHNVDMHTLAQFVSVVWYNFNYGQYYAIV